MKKSDILTLAEAIAKKHGRDPFTAAEAEGIGVSFYPFHRLPGMRWKMLFPMRCS